MIWNNHNLEYMYGYLDRYIALIEGYTEISNFANIIRACRLKPYPLFSRRDATYKLTLKRHWIDEYGNSLKIVGKNPKIIFGDLNIPEYKNICTDLYHGLSLYNKIKISKLAYLCYGRDEDLYQDCIIISLLGIDNYLRTYLYLYGEWMQVSPLIIGINQLSFLFKYQNVNFKELVLKKNIPIPCNDARVQVICLPADERVIKSLETQCDVVYSILKGSC